MAKMKVVGGALNVRREPSLEAEITHVLAEDEEITVGKEKDGWCAFGSGYIMARWLAPVETDLVSEAEEIKTAASEIKEAAKEIKKAAKKTTKKTDK